MEFVMRPIGEIHSPFIDKRDTPIQASRSTTRGQVEVYPAYVDGLRDLDGFSHIILLYAFHRSDNYTLRRETVSRRSGARPVRDALSGSPQPDRLVDRAAACDP